MNKNLRTYQRRQVTRNSGYHTCEGATGGECKVFYAEKSILKTKETILVFKKSNIKLEKLFNENLSIIGFGGYIYMSDNASIDINCEYSINGILHKCNNRIIKIQKNIWSNVGAHYELKYTKHNLDFFKVNMVIKSKANVKVNFFNFDMGTVYNNELKKAKLKKTFYQKTAMHIPYIYYFDSHYSINEYLVSKIKTTKGKRLIVKNCNRCGRFLPINIDDEFRTICYSLHCKSNACTHPPTFRSYEIKNINELSKSDLKGLNVENNRILSKHGHQLECKACKKFFVNAPLNPQRNAQQFKEDSLRRRALEVLITKLENTKTIHQEFEHRTKKQFSEYIWEKFNKKCFNCGADVILDTKKNKEQLKKSGHGEIKIMALDHTLPLAYLYKLDETATCLCDSCNSKKSDTFPVEFYSKSKLKQLSKITGLSIKKLSVKTINNDILELLVQNITMFYDDFLMDKEYQKIRDGRKTADKIQKALDDVIGGKVDLINEYYKINHKYPKSITIK